MTTLDHYSFEGKCALIRVDFNVPLNADFQITDTTRITATIPTIQKVLKEGGRAVLMSHLGRPKNGPEDRYSLRHLVAEIAQQTGAMVHFAPDCIGEEALHKAKTLQAGEILLLENLRFYKEEEKGDRDFAAKLARYGDVWVNDAFGTAHRAHASTAVIADCMQDRVCGYVMQAELDNAKKVLENVEKPYTAIMGGAKISDKILIIERLLDHVDTLIIGGGMAYTFFKAMGGSIGNSLVETDRLELAKTLIDQAKAKQVDLLLPLDSVAADAFAADAHTRLVMNHAIPKGWMGLDIGPQAREVFSAAIRGSKTILWNGPMGVFEMTAFEQGTKAIAQAVVDATAKGAFSLIGGGDSAAAVNQFGMAEQVSYVSTGGGALLEYMEGKVLPGVAALG